jgi:hypothetical protein
LFENVQIASTDTEEQCSEKGMARHVCGVLAHNGQIEQLPVRSQVGGDGFRLFVSEVEGESNELTNENVDGRSAFCDEFQFISLSQRPKGFKSTVLYRLENGFGEMEEGIE